MRSRRVFQHVGLGFSLLLIHGLLRRREATVHGSLPWRPTDRQRRVLVLRYSPHDGPARPNRNPPEILVRLSPETVELTASVGPNVVKDIVRRGGPVQLTDGSTNAKL